MVELHLARTGVMLSNVSVGVASHASPYSPATVEPYAVSFGALKGSPATVNGCSLATTPTTTPLTAATAGHAAPPLVVSA